MFDWLKALFSPPRPAGPPQSLRKFGPDDETLTRDGVSVEECGWKITSGASRTVRLFEVAEPGVEQCMLTYRAQLKTENAEKRVFLEMWCRFPGRGEFFSKGFHHAISGTTDWASCETPFYLKKGERPDLVKLNLVTEGAGTVRVREIELLCTPLA